MTCGTNPSQAVTEGDKTATNNQETMKQGNSHIEDKNMFSFSLKNMDGSHKYIIIM